MDKFFVLKKQWYLWCKKTIASIDCTYLWQGQGTLIFIQLKYLCEGFYIIAMSMMV